MWFCLWDYVICLVDVVVCLVMHYQGILGMVLKCLLVSNLKIFIDFILTLNAPITTKVVCFSRLLRC